MAPSGQPLFSFDSSNVDKHRRTLATSEKLSRLHFSGPTVRGGERLNLAGWGGQFATLKSSKRNVILDHHRGRARGGRIGIPPSAGKREKGGGVQ